MTTPEEIKAEYTSSLADLTFNSKPLINVLTMLAEENLPNAKIIVEAIEEHLAKVATDVKLPILYLIDCIVKNVGETYTGLFSQNIVSTFCTVFKKVDEKTRLEMFKLRQTWNDVFPQMKLYAIDVQIHQIDPAWPVTAQPTNSIHLNPKFLKNTTTTSKTKIAAATNEIATPSVPTLPIKPAAADLDKETRLMQEQLMQKQKELLELQRKTLELEVLQTQVKLQEQMKAGGVSAITTNILLKPEVAKQLLPDAMGKTRSTDIMSSLVQKSQPNQLKINPVNSALAAARPIRDPRLLRQQQEKHKSEISSQAIGSALGMAAPNSTVLDTNKHVTNKLGVRNIHKDPRLSTRNEKKNRNYSKPREDSSVNRVSSPVSSQKVDKTTRIDLDKSTSDSRFTSSSSSSLSSSSSTNLDTVSKNKRSPGKHRKRDKPDAKRTHDFELNSSTKREKVSPKEDEKRQSDSSQVSSTFKTVKGKSRNYIRRNLTDSPVPVDDEDLRASSGQSDKNDKLLSTDNTTVKQKSPEPSTSISTATSLDVDLRQPTLAPSKKRLSSETSEQPPKKRSFDVLFGSEDTDLRQLSIHAEAERKAPIIERPPTPPPPIISAKKDEDVVQETGKPLSPKKSNFDAVRAKLANATNRDKVMNKSFHKSKIQQSLSTDKDLRPRVMISPEEEKVIRSGHMTTEQEKQFLNKFLSQIEQDKLRQAKKKDHEEAIGDMSLQEISDEEFGSDSEVSPKSAAPLPHPPIPFNDKDERLNLHHMPTAMTQVQHVDNVPPLIDNGSYYSKGDNRRPPFRGGRDWRGRGRMPLQAPHPRPPIRPWLHQQQPRWGSSFADESSRSPGEDLEMTIIHEENKTLNIDGIPRDIRIYNETAIIFLNYDDPREISFQNGARRVIFNNKETYLLMFGAEYTECSVNNFVFRVKLGVPSREIFINEIGFECFFGGPPVHITVNGINMTVQLDGPLPQVKIGEVKRPDLVVGKINLIINATLMIPVFLDGKLQTFMVEGEPCTLKFVDALKRVLINDVPFNVEFGGLPKPCIIHGKKHFIRFSVLPKGIRPGFVRIKDMEGESGSSPIREEENILTAVPGPLEAEPLRPDISKVKQVGTGQQSPDNGSKSPNFFNNILQTGLGNFDVISNVLTQSLTPAPSTGGYQVELPGLEPSVAATDSKSSTTNVPTANPTFNINELFQKLVDSGFVKTHENKQSEAAQSAFTLPQLSTTIPKEVNPYVGNGKDVQRKPYHPKDQASSKPQKRNVATVLKPVSFGRPETLKIRQSALYSKLYAGMQCSSCGMRFSPEASMWYSQHLDWHFRQNRKGKKNARVANSRKWYYSLADWKNYEELEDLEEREKNYFDQQQQVEVAEEAEEEVEIPSVTADPGTTDERCNVCRDVFEQFFNEEKEEWHLRNAIRVEEKTYHPVCYEDHQKSMLDKTKSEEETPSKLIPGLEIILDDDEEDIPGSLDEVVSLMDDIEELVPEDAPSPAKDEDVKEDVVEDDGDDDDVILNEVAPIKIVVDDDDDDDQVAKQNDFSDPPVIIKKEKNLEFDDGFMDVGEIVSLKDVGQVTIKSEPLDDMQPPSLKESGDNPVEEPPIELNADDEVTPSKPVTSHPELITSMDGNVELMSTAPMPVSTTISGGPKIKINISKPLPVITPKDINNESSDSDVNRSTEVPVEELEILRYKPALQNVPLRKLPPVKKGNELTGLCSIM